MKLEQAEIPLERDMFMRSLLQLTLRAYASDGVVVVEVIDTGIGTPPGVNIF
jgi:signal transduction histidine kinase